MYMYAGLGQMKECGTALQWLTKSRSKGVKNGGHQESDLN